MMTKNEYLDELRKELKLNNVVDIEDIISEYDEHFNFKMNEGLTEEEIARKLSSPREIAKEYGTNAADVNKFEKNVKVTGIVAMSIPMAAIYALIWASVVVLGGFALCSLATGFCLITTINIGGLIPAMPYFPALVLGIACFGLATLSAVGTIYFFLYTKQWGKVYIRWCSNIINNNRYPSISKHPKIAKRLDAKLKLIAIIGLACFLSAAVIGYFSMCIAAGSMEPWHTWNWFQ